MKQFLDPTAWRNHLSSNCSVAAEKRIPGGPNPLGCPYRSLPHLSLPQCKDTFKSSQDVDFHLQDIHCVPFIKPKRSKPADEVATTFREYKRARSIVKRETDNKGCVTQVYEFVDETEAQRTQKTHRTPKRSSSTPSVRSSKSLSTAPSTAPSTPPSLNSRASTPITDLDEESQALEAGESLTNIAAAQSMC
jgi:hypothetical protein